MDKDFKNLVLGCQNCKILIVIESEDFNFYEKIKVPPPTFCHDCKTMRRLSWRNEMSLFKRKCSAPGHDEMIISIYPPEQDLVVYDLKYWWSDAWDPFSFGVEYDFSKTFFQQWIELYRRFPLQTLSNSKSTNSDYCNVADESRDSYMTSGSWKIERTFYSNRISEIKDSSDLYLAFRSELCYDSVGCTNSYHLLYSFNCKSCVDSYFLYDCHGSVNCFGCSNLRNKSYCIWNQQLSKEEYHKRLEEIDLTSYKTVSELKEKFHNLYLNSIHRFAKQIKVIDSTGDNIEGTKNCKACFDTTGKLEDSRNVHWALNAKDLYDCGPGVGEAELMYECFDTGIGNFRNLFTSVVYSASEVEYAFNCYGVSHLFGCIGLRSKHYCILNKQYTKEEYEEILPKIKKHMEEMPYVDKLGRVYKYGEFFPSELSPFSYNETVAQDYFPLDKDTALKFGYRWKDKKQNEYKITMLAGSLPDNLKDVSESITKEVIGCAHEGKCQDRCTIAYKITPEELGLYLRLGVPLPRLCFGCRHEARLRQRNPLKLWHGQCMCLKENHGHSEKCTNEFETPFSPERPETVYCESCYQKEVL